MIRAGAGIDTIDVATASSHGVFVSNCPGKNSIAVAELVLGLLLACDRRIPDQVAELRAGTWNKGEFSKARGLHGRTLGIVGLGQIGREIAARARAFGMRVIAWSRSLTHEEADRLGMAYAQTPLEVARLSDAVTINVAGNAETKQLVNAEFLAAMRPGAYLINTSRGSVVDEAALERAVREKGIRAGLDVFENEPAGNTGTFGNADRSGAGRLRHAPRRCVHRPGAGRDRARGDPHRADVPGDGRGAQRGQPARAELGHARAVDPASQPAGGAGARVRRAGGRRRSTSKRSRTSSTTAPRPRSRGSISTACPTRARSSGSGTAIRTSSASS